MKTRLFLMMGCPGSGKSTFIEKNMSMFNSPKIISRDKIRFSLLKEGDDYFSKENEVFKRFIKDINNSLNRGYGDTIVDATHISQGSRRKLLNAVQSNYDEVIVIWVKVPLSIALERNKGRDGLSLVPEDSIRNMHHNLTKPCKEEGIDKLWIVTASGDIKRELL